MNNIKRYNMIYVKLFGISEESISEDLDVLNVEDWDSVAQMNMASLIEEEFGIFLDPDELIELVSYKNGIKILRSHGVEV